MGTDVSVADSYSDALLHMASMHNHEVVARLLIEKAPTFLQSPKTGGRRGV